MIRTLCRMLVLVLLLSGKAAAADAPIKITNNTGYQIQFVYVLYRGDSCPSDDILGNDVLPDGASILLQSPTGNRQLEELTAQDEDGDRYSIRPPMDMDGEIVITLDNLQ
ncbi:MAG: hypothetical protein CMK85_13770 [Pseudomonadales bacterium]|jgi:hypothetical protein|uniref:hypothetical protein n=1 Tax=Halopseudomonas TaxID=2901189 RepID=UPI000C563D19|nr:MULTISPECIES: hypothetical protein [Halopseudomonas]MAD27815.1 hypothetical protein [Pseudomonadales bacterium]MEE2799965.1 hypothetical protein [Pseudomonadota bacterium]HBT55789.1 hypothetical protein [Pseudomonas sp.]MAK75488.1 hypothetical protein [Pseudomonadales bacterium]MAP76621.1 hypothetical protein [Pseudomonadales bacterium]